MQMLLHTDKKTNNTIESERENPDSQVMERCGSAQVAREMQWLFYIQAIGKKSKKPLTYG